MLDQVTGISRLLVDFCGLNAEEGTRFAQLRNRRGPPSLAGCIYFCVQMSLSVSSMLRALAYSLKVVRAASQRSALVNSCVDITAPLMAPPTKLTTIKTWTILFSPPSLLSMRDLDM